MNRLALLVAALAPTVAVAQPRILPADPPAVGIQWFTTWESAKAEAARTGRPILLVSAAPHCGGVSGIW
ncbi:MAG: hypothetical protein ABGY75_05695 [Gemmataceae bacterium]